VLLVVEDGAAARAADALAHGVISTSWSGEEIVRTVCAAAAELAGPAARTVACPGDGDWLTTREHAVLELIAAGATNREIGWRLHLSPDTIKDETVRLYRKLGVQGRAQAVHRAALLGLV
jgi:ATP/maltotriose-dependent transcriptional regulator MalT